MNEAVTKEQREQLIAATRWRVKQLWGRIFRRDIALTIAAGFVIYFFGRYCFADDFVVRMSALWLVFFAVADIYKTHRTRIIRKPASSDVPVGEFCRIELDRLGRQMKLQYSLLWYIVSSVVLAIMFFIGREKFGIASLVYGIVTLLIAWSIYALAVRPVAKGLMPLRNELSGLLRQLGDAAGGPASWAKTGAFGAGDPEDAVKVTKWIALGTLMFCLFIAVCLFIARATGASDSGPVSGYLIYCIVTLHIGWDIYRAKPLTLARPAGADTTLRNERAVQVAQAKFIGLTAIIVFLMALTLPVVAFDSGGFIYCLVIWLVAWGIYRVKSAPLVFVMVWLMAVAFIGLAVGAFDSSYDGAPRSEGPGGDWLADRITYLRRENKLVGLAAMVMVDGKVTASAAHGERKKRSGVPLTLGDRWHLGSITKSITATMIGRLVESGRMKWTDTIGEGFANASIHDDWKRVTLRQLLTPTRPVRRRTSPFG